VNWTTAIAICSVSVSLATLLLLWFRGAKSEAKTDEQTVTALDGRIKALEKRAENTERDVAEIKSQVSMLPIISAQLAALDRLFSFRMDGLEKKVDLVDRKIDSGNGTLGH
jgi:phage shock protein A